MAGSDRSVVVLVDNSRSMALFQSTAMLALIDSIRESRQTDIRIVSFGDSLRTCGNWRTISFQDDHSNLPLSWKGTGGASARRCLIVSDGNWSNTEVPEGLFEEKECFYLPLGTPHFVPFIHLETTTSVITSVVDSSVQIPLRVNGYSPISDTIKISGKEVSGIIGTHRLIVGPGLFADTVNIPLSSHKSGRYVTTTSAVMSGSRMSGESSFMHIVTPRKLRVAMAGSNEGPDGRFLQLALNKNPEWEMTANGAESDLLILSAWNKNSDSLIGRVRPTTMLFFMGALPCITTSETAASGTPVCLEPALLSAFAGRPLPTPATIISCPANRFLNGERTLIGLSRLRNGRLDTLPILSLGQYRGKWAIAGAFHELWKWDFWPKSLPEETVDAESFSTILLSIMHARIVDNLTAAFLVIPDHSPVGENEPIPLHITLPNSNGTQGEPVLLRLTLRRSDGKEVFDSTVTLSSGFDREASVIVPAQSSGSYTIRTSVQTGGGRIQARNDSLVVNKSDAETQIGGQNHTLLQQVARLLPVNGINADGTPNLDRTALANALNVEADKSMQTVSRIVHFRQSGILLGLILLLLGAEWVIRRRLSSQ